MEHCWKNYEFNFYRNRNLHQNLERWNVEFHFVTLALLWVNPWIENHLKLLQLPIQILSIKKYSLTTVQKCLLYLVLSNQEVAQWVLSHFLRAKSTQGSWGISNYCSYQKTKHQIVWKEVCKEIPSPNSNVWKQKSKKGIHCLFVNLTTVQQIHKRISSIDHSVKSVDL